MNEILIEKALASVKKLFEGNSDGHDFFHTERVYKTALKLAKTENADLEITALAAILHDADDRKLSPETCENKLNAGNILTELGIDSERQTAILKIISEVSFVGTDSPVPETKEGKCVQDADRLDAMGAIGIARAFAFGGSRGRQMYNPDIKPTLNADSRTYAKIENSTSVNHFYEKLFLLKDMMNTEAAKRIATEREQFMKEFLEEFYKEWNG
ncbi:MAG: HD domain-containing protein [Clostridia bacterium]|nr:HD domain-containing protein [Clostridia bacterium]